MKYIVMECHPSFAVLLDEDGRFIKAANLNYEDASYMCRFFKKEAGMSPIEFRNKTKYREL